MRGKKFLALASIFAGVALVGSTFALWAVTDNADPFSVRISPGSIASDTETKRVTLSYGDRVYSNVGNIVNGTKRLAATVELKAEWTVDENYPTFSGLFNVELSQTSSNTVKLIDYLNVYVESAAPTITDGVVTSATSGSVGTLAYNDEDHKAGFSVTLNSPVANVATKTVYVIVEYKSTTAANIDALASDEVTLTLDWNKPATGTVSGYTIYYAGNSTDVHVFAWNQANTKVNSSYPGVAMTQVRPGLYSYELSDEYYGFLLVHEDETKLTQDDVIVSTWKTTYYDTDKPCYDGSAWIAVPEETNYYVVGSFNMSGTDWKLADANYKMSASGNNYVFSGLTLEANDQIKIYTDSGTGSWYGVSTTYDNCGYVLGDDGNAKVGSAGTYDVTFYPDGQGGNFIMIAAHS